MTYGGFPDSIEHPFSYEFLRELFDRIVTRDIIQRYSLRDPKTLKQLALLMVSYSGHLLSYHKIKNQFSFGSLNTLRKYIFYILETYLCFELEPYSAKVRERMNKPKKIYCIDTGLYNSLQSNPKQNLGRQLENVVFLEYRRNQKEIYFKSTKEYEVDFIVVERNKVKTLVQVTVSFSDPEVRKREIKSLIKAAEELKCNDLMILTLNEDDEIKTERAVIRVLPVFKWLLKRK